VRKLIVILLAVMFMAAAGLAQMDPLLGSHNVSAAGCNSCHAPHNVLPGPGAYLWSKAIPTGTYTTYLTSDGNGGSLNASAMIPGGMTNAYNGTITPTAVAHTILCLSCHDTTFNTSMATLIPASTIVYNNFNVGNNANLSGDHPVDVKYPTTNPMYWTLSPIAAGSQDSAGQYTVTFLDTTFAYGHPARLFSTDGINAYIECASCHNPHNQTVTVVNWNNTLKSVNTTHFVRGQYRATNEIATGAAPVLSSNSPTTYQVDNTNFCMSCHAYPTTNFSGLVQ